MDKFCRWRGQILRGESLALILGLMLAAFVAVVRLTRLGCLRRSPCGKKSSGADTTKSVHRQKYQRNDFKSVTHVTVSLVIGPYFRAAIFECQLSPLARPSSCEFSRRNLVRSSPGERKADTRSDSHARATADRAC
jgi:hypothetical protein